MNDKKLDEILEWYNTQPKMITQENDPKNLEELNQMMKNKLKSYFKQEKHDLLNRVEEALGEDETGKKDTPEGELYYPTRNGLRAELRHRISDMREKL